MVLVCQDLNLHVKIWAWCYWLRNLRPKNQAEVIMQIITKSNPDKKWLLSWVCTTMGPVCFVFPSLSCMPNRPFALWRMQMWSDVSLRFLLNLCASEVTEKEREGFCIVVPIALLSWANRSGPGGSHPLFRINTPLGLSEAWANTFHAAHAHQSPCYTGRPSSHFFFSEGGWVVVEVCPPV